MCKWYRFENSSKKVLECGKLHLNLWRITGSIVECSTLYRSSHPTVDWDSANIYIYWTNSVWSLTDWGMTFSCWWHLVVLPGWPSQFVSDFLSMNSQTLWLLITGAMAGNGRQDLWHGDDLSPINGFRFFHPRVNTFFSNSYRLSQ